MRCRILIFTALLLAQALAPPAHAATQTRTSAFEYDTSTGLLTKEIIEPDDSNLCLVTTYAYDAYGNKTGATTRNCNGSTGEAAAPSGNAVIASRTSSTGYDSQGRFATSSTNALSQSETRAYDSRFGTLTSLTGPNSLSTTWSYDGFGRKLSESRADGTSSASTYSLCTAIPSGDPACPSGAVQAVRSTATGSPSSYRYTDLLGREVRSESQGFDGTMARKDTEYDALGRVHRTSKPYYAGSTVLWTTFAYDLLGRVSTSTLPTTAAGTLVTTSTYAGLVTTVSLNTSPAQTKTTTRNSQGQTVAVADTRGNSVGYAYDPFGNLARTVDALSTQTNLTYDLKGRKTQMVDADMGTWTYAYDALGELVSQTDARSNTTTMTYDALGRMKTRSETGLLSTWYYDAYSGGTCTKGIGKLCQVTTNGGYNRVLTYDSVGRLGSNATTIDGTAYTLSYTYDSSSRLDVLTYPTGFAVQHLYNSYGYLWKVQRTNDADTTVYWQASTQDASGHVTAEALGNGLATGRSYDALDRLAGVTAGSGGTYEQNLAYTYDLLGNVSQRQDAVQSITENFSYDNLNRLTQVSASGLATRSFAYNAAGNITSKSDVGTYTYPAATATKPHAVSGVTNGGAANSITGSYSYDANGNLTASSGTLYPGSGSAAFSRTLTYTSYNAPDMLTSVLAGATDTYTYTYNADHERVKLVTVRPDDTLTSIYLHPGGRGELTYEKQTRQSDGRIEHRHYINGGSGLVGVFLSWSSGSPATEARYFHQDHLGSIVLISNASGAQVERFGFESFGERRSASGAAQDRTSPIIGISTDRGFTGHEHLDEMNLIHMNGRIFDPALGRFMTPDALVQNAGNLQSYNRYSYAWNNPLGYTDPTGYKINLGNVFKAVAIAVAAVYTGGAAAAWYEGAAAFAILEGGTAFTIAGGISGTSAIVAGAAGGFTAGFLASGGDIQAGLQGAAMGGIGGGFGAAFAGSGLFGQMTGSGINGYLQTGCPRRLNIDPPCRLNIDPGPVAAF